MMDMDVSAQFRAIWLRALNQPDLDSLSTDLVESWARSKGLDVSGVEERDVGAFGRTRSIVLTVAGGRACFPKITCAGDPTWEKRRRGADSNAQLWEKMEWFSPLWVARGKIDLLLKDAANGDKERAVNSFNYHTSTIYTLAFEAMCIEQLMSQARSLSDFVPIAREAYLAFYSGHRASSIAALIPAIEGALTRIAADQGADLTLPDKIDAVFARAIGRAARMHFEDMWTPREYLTTEFLLGQDERVFFLETFRRWLLQSFFRRTGEYDGATWLNRHLFAHGMSASWQQSANFSRLVVALATLGVVESWHDDSQRVSLFFPEMNEASKLLWQQAKFRAGAQFFIKLIEEKLYHRRGHLVPEFPTDDGVLMRQAILSEECIRDLVRPLRDAGWSVEVGEPEGKALHVSVVATAGETRLRVALLYSCATGNDVYRELAETSDVILYRGSPYHQRQYAYGLKTHVGPVTGWQPPPAPGSPKRRWPFWR